jgi:predicted metal-dependent peptidase
VRFSKLYGHHDPAEVKQAEDKMSKVFVELAAKPDATSMITGLGGDPLIFSLLLPIEHVASVSMPTAATDGLRYIWNIEWILAASYLKLRLTCFHEALHAQFMHPQRKGNRDPKLWNIVIDYIVMGMIFDCLKHHFSKNKRVNAEQKSIETFREGFGNYITVAQLKAKYLNPDKDIPGIESWTPEPIDFEAAKKRFEIEDDLDEEDIEWIKSQVSDYKYVFADPNLEQKFKNPYVLYDELHKVIPKCDECGRVGAVVQPGSGSGKGKGAGGGGKDPGAGGSGDTGEPKDVKGGKHGHEEHSEGSCGKCAGAGDIFGFGSTADEHMDCLEDPTKLAKRLTDAIDMAKRIGAGYIPAGLDTEIGELSKPRVRWQDEVRMTKQKIAANGSKNDYTRWRTRPLFAAMFVPRKKSYTCNWAVLLDTSGSQDKDDKALGISQIQNLDDQGTGVITYVDAECYWKETVKLRSCRPNELAALVPKGGGGTKLAGYFDEYEQRLGKKDFLIVITDGQLKEEDILAMKAPGVPVFWLLTSEVEFVPPFGKAFRLKS